MSEEHIDMEPPPEPQVTEPEQTVGMYLQEKAALKNLFGVEKQRVSLTTLYLLFRSSHGYGLFEVNGGETVDSVRSCVSDPNRFCRAVKFTVFRPYKSLKEAFNQNNAVRKGFITEELRRFLVLNLPKVKQGENVDYSLGTHPKLGQLIFEATTIPCVSNELVSVLLNGVLRHFESRLCQMKDETPIGPIPSTILNSILPRLPIKTLLRFRLACKEWESIICHPDFRVSQESRRPLYTVCESYADIRFITANQVAGNNWFLEEPLARLELEGTNASIFYYDWFDNFEDIYPEGFPLYPGIQHEHGLILVDAAMAESIIYNPTTRETLELPLMTLGSDNKRTFLHYDPVSNKYKCLYLLDDDGWLEAGMMEIGDSAWKILTLPADGIRFDGVPYATQAYHNSCLYVVDKAKIMRFNTAAETLEEVCLVPANIMEPYFLFLYKGKLAITTLFMGVDPDQLWLCTLDEAAHEWTRMDFVLDEATEEALTMHEKRGITANGELILVLPVFGHQNVIHYFNPEDGTLNTSHAQLDDMIDLDVDLYPRSLLDINHVDHLRFLNA